MDLVTIAISQCLNVPENSIQIEVKYVGGAFGAKESRSSQVACAAALACHLTGLPIRFVMSLESNMNVMGKRCTMRAKYTIDVDPEGKVVKLTGDTAQDMGCSMNDSYKSLIERSYPNCYDASSWKYTSQFVKTDAPSMTWCRAPGTTGAIAMAEIMMEHIANVLDKDPIAVRITNMAANSKMKSLLPDFVKDVGK